jgi:ABC-type microcin C transport system duplicated ATPase subunit YejF
MMIQALQDAVEASAVDLNAGQRYEMVAMVRSGKTTVVKLRANLVDSARTIVFGTRLAQADARRLPEPGPAG